MFSFRVLWRSARNIHSLTGCAGTSNGGGARIRCHTFRHIRGQYCHREKCNCHQCHQHSHHQCHQHCQVLVCAGGEGGGLPSVSISNPSASEGLWCHICDTISCHRRHIYFWSISKHILSINIHQLRSRRCSRRWKSWEAKYWEAKWEAEYWEAKYREGAGAEGKKGRRGEIPFICRPFIISSSQLFKFRYFGLNLKTSKSEVLSNFWKTINGQLKIGSKTVLGSKKLIKYQRENLPSPCFMHIVNVQGPAAKDGAGLCSCGGYRYQSTQVISQFIGNNGIRSACSTYILL